MIETPCMGKVVYLDNAGPIHEAEKRRTQNDYLYISLLYFTKDY